MHLGVRDPLHQVIQVWVGEDRIMRPPKHEGRHIEAPHVAGDRLERSVAGVVRA